MKRFYNSLRFRLILLVLLAALPAMGLIVYNAHSETAELRREAQEQTLRLAHLAAMEHQTLISSTRLLLATLAELPELRSRNIVACYALLSRLLSLNPAYANFGVADANGDIFCSAVLLSAPVNIADRGYFQAALTRREFSIGSYQIGRITGKPSLNFGFPILENNAVVGVAFAALDLSWLEQLAKSVNLPTGAVYTVVDRQGMILARIPEGEKWVGKLAPDGSVVAAILPSTEEGVIEASGVDGVTRLYAYAPLPQNGDPSAHVIVGLPLSQVYAEANRTLWFNLGFLGGFTLLGLLTAWVGGEVSLVRRVGDLLHATRRMAQGDLSARTTIPYNVSELKELAHAFNDMAQSLEARERQRQAAVHSLLESEARFHRALENLPDLVVILDPDLKIRYINTARDPLTSRPAAELIGKRGEEIWPAEIVRLYSPVLEKTLQTHEIQTIEATLTLPESGLHHLKITCVPELDDHGNLHEILGIVYDFTELKQAQEKIVRQVQTLSALYASAQRLAESLEPQIVAEEVARACVETFGARLAWLGRAEADGRVTIFSQFPPDHPYPGLISVRWDDTPEGQGPTGRAIRSGSAVICPDFLEDPFFSPWRSHTQAHSLRSSAAIPLVSRGRTIGALNVYSADPGAFDVGQLETFQALASLAAAALENARLYSETRHRLERIEALREIDMAITSSLDIRVSLNVLLDHVTARLNVDAAAVLLYNPYLYELTYAAGRGFRSGAIERTRLRMGVGHAGYAALERRSVSVADLREKRDHPSRADLVEKEGFIAYHAMPMMAKGRLLGVLEVFHRARLESVTQEWQTFLEALAAQAAIAVDNAQLFLELEQSNLNLRLAYDATIEGWSRAMDLRDEETEGHTQRVTEWTVRLARAFGMKEDEIVHVRRGALLHDIGKMGVPDAILLKPGKLTAEEWEIMQKHPQFAHEMLMPIEYLRPAIDIPYCHHEKWDGSGYPRGLKGENIPLAARLFAVVDVWDALRSDRPYRPRWPEDQVLAHIRSLAGTHFDPQVVECFLKLLAEQPSGEEVSGQFLTHIDSSQPSAN